MTLVLFGNMRGNNRKCRGGVLEATPEQLAAVLQHLTALRSLGVHGFARILFDGDCDAGEKARHSKRRHGAAGVAACVECVCGLPALASLGLELPVRLDSNARRQLAGITMTQLLQLRNYSVEKHKLSMFM